MCALGTHCSSNSVVFLNCETKLKPIYYRWVRARATLLTIAVCVWLAFWNIFRILSSWQTMACFAQFRMHNGRSVENIQCQPCVERQWGTNAWTLTEFVGSIHWLNICVCFVCKEESSARPYQLECIRVRFNSLWFARRRWPSVEQRKTLLVSRFASTVITMSTRNGITVKRTPNGRAVYLFGFRNVFTMENVWRCVFVSRMSS